MKESNSTDGNYQYRDYTPFVKAAILTNLSMRPFVYLGSGALGGSAYREIISFAEKISSPIGASVAGANSIHTNHSLFFGLIGVNGMFEANKAMAEADLIIAVGASSCADIKYNSNLLKNKKIICVSESEGEIQSCSKESVNLFGDTKEIFALLKSITLGHYNSNNFWIRDIKNSARVNLTANKDASDIPAIAYAK